MELVKQEGQRGQRRFWTLSQGRFEDLQQEKSKEKIQTYVFGSSFWFLWEMGRMWTQSASFSSLEQSWHVELEQKLWRAEFESLEATELPLVGGCVNHQSGFTRKDIGFCFIFYIPSSAHRVWGSVPGIVSQLVDGLGLVMGCCPAVQSALIVPGVEHGAQCMPGTASSTLSYCPGHWHVFCFLSCRYP